MAEVYTDSIRAKVNGETQDVPIRDTTKSPAIIPTVTGTAEVTITDASDESKLQNLTMHGNTNQVQTTGAQLFNPEEANFGNCTFVDDKEYTIKSNVQNRYYCAVDFNYLNEYILQNKGKNLTVSCKEPLNGKYVSIAIYGTRTDGGTYQELNGQANDNKATITIADDFESVNRIELRFNRSDTTFTDTTTEISNIMLNEGSTALPYEPYTERYPSPRPEIPSKNLLDYSLIQNKTMNGITFTNNNDGTFTVNGTATAQATTDPVTITLPVGTYYVSDNSDSEQCTLFVQRTPAEGDAQTVRNGTITIADGDTVTAYLSVSAEAVLDNFVLYPMIEKGNTESFWEPYGTITAHPQPIVSAGKHIEATDDTEEQWQYEIGVGGAQLFDASKIATKTQGGATVTNNGDGSFTISGSGNLTSIFSSSYTAYNPHEFLKEGMVYSNGSKNIPEFYIFGNSATGDVLFTTGVSGSANITKEILKDLKTITFVFYSNSGTITPTTFYPMVYQDGDGTWEPYRTPQSALLTTTRPLTKWDKLEKRNGQWGWVYKSNTVEFDGSEDEVWTYSGQRLGFAQAYTNLPNAYEFTSNELSVLFCNKFSVFGENEWSKPTKVCISIGFSEQAGRIGINIEDITINNNETLRAWLSENPMTVVYETSTETFTPLSESEQSAMDDLVMYAPTSIVSADTGDLSVELEVSYIADTTTYLTANFVPKSDYNALEARVSALESAAVNNVTEQ